MFCIKCGSKSLEDAEFCQKCGARLVGNEEERQVADKPVEYAAPPVQPPRRIEPPQHQTSRQPVTEANPDPAVQPPTSRETTKRGNKILTLVIVAVVVIAIAVALVILAPKMLTSRKHISSLKNSVFEENGRVTVEEVYGKLFKKVKYSYGSDRIFINVSVDFEIDGMPIGIEYRKFVISDSLKDNPYYNELFGDLYVYSREWFAASLIFDTFTDANRFEDLWGTGVTAQALEDAILRAYFEGYGSFSEFLQYNSIEDFSMREFENNYTESGNGSSNNANSVITGGNSANSSPTKTDGFELALITDLGTIDDRSFNQGAWEGLVQYAQENGITHKYYQPADQGDDAYLNAIDLAVQGGAKVVVAPGFLFEVPVYIAQDRYPNVKFILLDGSPNNGDYDNFVGRIGPNTVSVFYAEEQSGFLAGYAAVRDGYRSLGFMGAMPVPAVIRFGHGYVQGAEYAARELGLAYGSVKMKYYYTWTFAPQPEIQTMAAAWYNDGVEVIFSCGGGICFSIFPAAVSSGNKVIGVDGDQSGESPSVITSAMKILSSSVYDCLTDYYDGKFRGGQTVLFYAANRGVGLPMETSKFRTFSQSDYNAIYAKLANGSVSVDDNISITPDMIPTKSVKVDYIG